MHNFDWVWPFLFWISIIGGFGIGFYTGIVAVAAVNKHIKRNKK